MKKIILIIILFFNIFPDISNTHINIGIGNKVYGQECPPPTEGPGGGTSPSWWQKFTEWLTGIVNSSVDVGELFNGNTSNFPNSLGGLPITWNSGFNENSYGSLGGGVDGYWFNPTNIGNSGASTNIGLFYFEGVASWDWGELDSLEYSPYYQLNTTICQMQFGSSAMLDPCGICVSGTSGRIPCNVILPISSDTLKPQKINCDSIDVNRNIRATKSTQILDFISHSSDSAIIINARDSAPIRKFEVGFSIRRLQPTPGNFTYKPYSYEKNGLGRNVQLYHHSTSVAYLHVHNPKDSAGVVNNQGPSPVDFYSLLEEWNDSSYLNTIDISYVISGDSARNEFAIMIADSAKAKQFLLRPRNTVINSSTNPKYVNNWFGTDTTRGTYYYDFIEAVKMFKAEGYPKGLLDTYANVYMLQKKGMGIKLQQKVNGQFKELNFVEETDALGKKHYKIKICQ